MSTIRNLLMKILNQVEYPVPQRKSILTRTLRCFRQIIFSLVNSIGPSVSGNYLITENIKSPKRVIFKDLPEMPESGTVSPIIVEEVCSEKLKEVPFDPNFPEHIVQVKHYHIVPEKEELQLNSYYEENTADSEKAQDSVKSEKLLQTYSLSALFLLPFNLARSVLTSTIVFFSELWAKLFFSEPELRRSRRLQGLNPEQLALQEKARQRRIHEMKDESSFIPDQEDNLDKIAWDPKTSNSDKFEQKRKLTNKKSNQRQSILNWFFSLFYRRKGEEQLTDQEPVLAQRQDLCLHIGQSTALGVLAMSTLRMKCFWSPCICVLAALVA